MQVNIVDYITLVQILNLERQFLVKISIERGKIPAILHHRDYAAARTRRQNEPQEVAKSLKQWIDECQGS